MLTKDLDGPLDDCKDLGDEEIGNLNGWVERFDEKVSGVSEMGMAVLIVCARSTLWLGS